MSRVNTPTQLPRTHEGLGAPQTPIQELRRSALACLLWEDTFYENGIEHTERLKQLLPKCAPAAVAQLAIDARTNQHLRHLPLFLCRELARGRALRAQTLADCIQRADELAEFLAIYFKDGRIPLSAQAKKGLALAFRKFNEYQLAKYNRDAAIKLRDVLRLCHPKPADAAQSALWSRLLKGELQTPDTWETAISNSRVADRPAIWQRLLSERKLGALALLRNLRNMQQHNVPLQLIREALLDTDMSRVLPFRFIAASRFAPALEPELEQCLFRSLSNSPILDGHTVLLVDVSPSMSERLSAKSDMSRYDAADGLAMVARELCKQVTIYSFCGNITLIPPRRGFALRDAIKVTRGGSTHLRAAIEHVNRTAPYDRLIVISDEQSQDGSASPLPHTKAYMLNVGTYENGVTYTGQWQTISGFSESCVRYITALEASQS